MSWLRFSRSSGRITLYGGAAPNYCALNYPDQIGDWPAHNNAVSKSKGPWPAGVYRWSHYKAHAEAGSAPSCHNTAYGCSGIHVFSVSGRPGLGVHAGRTKGQDDVLGGKRNARWSQIHIPGLSLEQ